MEDKNHSRPVIAMMLVFVLLQGCASRMDTPYDPPPGATLFDQIPNNESSALHICAGHLPAAQRKPHQSGRC